MKLISKMSSCIRPFFFETTFYRVFVAEKYMFMGYARLDTKYTRVWKISWDFAGYRFYTT